MVKSQVSKNTVTFPKAYQPSKSSLREKIETSIDMKNSFFILFEKNFFRINSQFSREISEKTLDLC